MKTIKITGIGSASANPNQIELRFNLNTLELDYNKAINNHNLKLNDFIKVFTSLGFKKEDVKTSSFNIYPKYKSVRKLNGDYEEKFEGYNVAHSLVVIFDYNMYLLNQIINNLSMSKTDPKISIKFTIKEKEEFQNLILENAYKDARRKAEILANVSNQKITNLISIDYSFADIHFYSETRYETAMAKQSSFAENITPTDINQSENVTFIFEIE